MKLFLWTNATSVGANLCYKEGVFEVSLKMIVLHLFDSRRNIFVRATVVAALSRMELSV